MSSYRRVIISISLIIFFTGCAQKQSLNSSKFELENRYIMLGLNSELSGNLKESYKYFNALYKKTENREYLIKKISLLIRLNRFEEAKKNILNSLDKANEKELISLKKFLITVYLKTKKFDKALKNSLELLKQQKSEENYELVSSIYLFQKEYEESLIYLEGAYSLNHSSRILDKIVSTLYIYLSDKDRAISYLETHSRLYGCEKKLCSNLVALYAEKQNIEGLISIYKRMYIDLKDKVYAKKVVELLVFKKEFNLAIEYLKANRVDDTLLLELYKMQNNFSDAKYLSLELYNKTKDISYLAQSAIFEYESSKNKNSKQMLNSVVKKLKEVVSILDNDTYQNYLGYILIDHNLNPKAGVTLVKKALEKDANSVYYLDSLAWGYYKLHKCKLAYKTMKKVVDRLGLGDKEVKLHWEKISKCYKGK